MFSTLIATNAFGDMFAPSLGDKTMRERRSCVESADEWRFSVALLVMGKY